MLRLEQLESRILLAGDISIADTIPPYNDMKLDFGSVGLGTSSEAQIVVTNNDYTTVNVSQMTAYNEQFSLTQPEPNRLLPAGYEINAEQIGYGQLDFGNINNNPPYIYDSGWYYLDATVGDRIEINAMGWGMPDPTIMVYTHYYAGENNILDKEPLVIGNGSVSFDATYTGRFYIEISDEGYDDIGSYIIETWGKPNSPLTLDLNTPHEATLNKAGSSGDVLWFRFEPSHSYRTYVNISNIPDTVNVDFYDQYGLTIPTKSSPNEYDITTDSMTYMRLQSQDPTDSINLDLIVTETGSVMEWRGPESEYGDTYIPIWFNPTTEDSVNSTMNIRTRDGAMYSFSLEGTGQIGDLAAEWCMAPATATAGTYVELSAIVGNLGPGNFSDEHLRVDFLLLPDNPYDNVITVDTITLDTSLNALEQIKLDTDVRIPFYIEGTYYLVINVDMYNNIPELDELNNLWISSYPIQIMSPDDDDQDDQDSISYFPDAISFYDTGLGQTSSMSYVWISNYTSEPITISDINTDDASFTWQEPAPATHLPWRAEADEITLVDLNTRYTVEIDRPAEPDDEAESELFQQYADDYPNIPSWWFNLPYSEYDRDFYSFQAEAGQLIDVKVTLNMASSGDLIIDLYSQSGQSLSGYLPSMLYETYAALVEQVFIAPYTGVYYLEINSYSALNNNTYDFIISESKNEIDEIVLDDEGIGQYTGSLTFPQDDIKDSIACLQFDATYADHYEIHLEVPEMQYPANLDYIEIYLPITLYDQYGQVQAYSYMYIWETSDNIQGSAYIDFTAYRDGPYYLFIDNVSSYYPPEQAAGDFEINIDITQIDSFLEIPAHYSTIVPVWFTPQHPGLTEGVLSIQTDAGGANNITVDLNGNGVPGDLTITELDFPELLVSNHVPSGEALQVAALIENWGMGNIDQEANLIFVLSKDSQYGNNDDLNLSPTFTIEALPWGGITTFNGSINIPNQLQGEYYLIAVIDPRDLVDEYPDDPLLEAPNIFCSELLYISPFGTVVTDSIDDPNDLEMDFGAYQIGAQRVEYVWVYNRSNHSIEITELELEIGENFQLPGWQEPQVQPEQFIIKPGQVTGINISFKPTTTQTQAPLNLTDTLTITTSEGIIHTINLYGSTSGPELLVQEDSGTANDDLLEMGAIRIGKDSDPVTVTLTNQGDQDLYINSLSFTSGTDDLTILVSENLPVVLEPFALAGDHLELQITFSPSATGEFTDNLVIASNDPLGDYILQLTGKGIAPAFMVYETLGEPNDGFLPFGWHPVGESATTTIQLVNTGTDTLTIDYWTLDSNLTGVFTLSSTNLPDNSEDDLILPPGADPFDLDLTFQASADGIYHGKFTIHSDDTTHVIDLSSLAGLSTLPSAQFRYKNVFLNELALDFGNVRLSETVSETFYIHNNGLVKLEVDDVEVAGAGYSISVPKLDQAPQGFVSLLPGENLLVNAYFYADPTFDIDDFSGVITVYSSTVQPAVVTLSAATVTPDISLSETAIDFGSVDHGTLVSEEIYITNEGSADLVIDWLLKSSQFEIKMPSENIVNGRLVVAPSRTVTADIIYQPTQVGEVKATLTLTTNDLDEPEQEIDIELSGYNPGKPFDIQSNETYPFIDGDGDLVTIRLTQGTARMYLTNGKLTDADIDTLELLGTDDSSQLKITVQGGQTNIGKISAEGSLSGINAPQVAIDRQIDIEGSLNKIILNDISDNAVINVGKPSSKSMAFMANRIGDDVDIFLNSEIKTFTAGSYASGNLYARDINQLNINIGDLGADVQAGSGYINRINVNGDISGDIEALFDINRVLSKTGSISGDIRTGENGSINSIIARKNISGEIIAGEDIKNINVKQGSLYDATIRARQVKAVNAQSMDNTIISTADNIGRVIIRTDVRDSYVLAGYDIGMSAMSDFTDDFLTNGNIGTFRFGGELLNSYLAAGVMSDDIYISLGLPMLDLPQNYDFHGSIGRIRGENIKTQSGGAIFGFYAAESINTKLESFSNFVVYPNYS